MPVQSNPAIQNVPMVAWDGAAARPGDVRNFVRFGWSFEVIAPIAVDAVFRVQSAPPSAADPCVPDVFTDVDEVATCQGEAVGGLFAEVTIPAGTPVGSICSGTIPCRPNAFVRLNSLSGTTASVLAILLRQGPRN